jgi:hypothetical protein
MLLRFHSSLLTPCLSKLCASAAHALHVSAQSAGPQAAVAQAAEASNALEMLRKRLSQGI